VISGMKAKEYLLSMKIEAANPQNGQKGEMQVEVSSWMAEKLPGYEEVSAFYKRMSEKMDMSSMASGPQAGIGKGMALAAKKLAEMEGVPVLQITRMVPTDPEQIKKMEEAAAQQSASQGSSSGVPSAGDAAANAAGQAATSAVANKMGRLGGLGSQGLGGLGGLRRKKQQQEEPPPPPPPAAVTEAAPNGVKGSFPSEASLMELTVESKNFSNSGVDDDMFAVPAGFKTVKSQMQK
jgi:hypothetical protein